MDTHIKRVCLYLSISIFLFLSRSHLALLFIFISQFTPNLYICLSVYYASLREANAPSEDEIHCPTLYCLLDDVVLEVF